ncbi:MAG TPA: VOC family protein [Pseudonocardia sp.]|nr:VOC family protein [Pseudonocardia sp.]
MEVLASRVLLRPLDPARSLHFYRDVLGLEIYREFPGGTVFFLGSGFLELSGRSDGPPGGSVGLWLRVRDVAAAFAELADRGATVLSEPRMQPWGLREAWVADPDGIRIALVEVPPDHPMRRDTRADPGA